MKYNTLAILGPTTSGKTETAIELAEMLNGCLICSDSLQHYEGFVFGTGRPTEDELANIPNKLYGFLSPKEPTLDVKEYYRLGSQARSNAIHNNLMPIYEGCNSMYAWQLVSRKPHASQHGTIKCFVLMPEEDNLEKIMKKKMRERLYDSIDKGLIDETSKMLDDGYEYTVPMQAVTSRWIARYIKGDLELEDAVEQIIDRSIKIVYRQIEYFKKIPHLTTVPFKFGKSDHLSEKIYDEICDQN